MVVVERGSQLAGLTTAQSVACFRAQWDDPEHASLVLPSIEVYESFGDRIGLPGWDIGLRRGGWLFITSAANGPARWPRSSMAIVDLGVHDSEALTGDEARHRFGWLGPEVTARVVSRPRWLGLALRGHLRIREGERRDVRARDDGRPDPDRRRLGERRRDRPRHRSPPRRVVLAAGPVRARPGLDGRASTCRCGRAPAPGDGGAAARDPGRRPDDARRRHPRLLAPGGRRRVPRPGAAGGIRANRRRRSRSTGRSRPW